MSAHLGITGAAVNEEDQLSASSTKSAKSETQSEQSSPRGRVIDVTDEWLGKSIAIVGAPSAKAGAAEGSSMQVERQLPTELSKSEIEKEPSNPFSDPCFTDNTKEMVGKSIAIVGAPPQKR